MDDLRTYKKGPQSGGDPKQLVVLLHGLGSNGQDLISLSPYLGSALPDAVFVSPDAPFPCDMAPVGYQWFSLQSREPEAMLQGLHHVMPTVDNFLSGLMDEYNIAPEKTALLGFSQGTMTSLFAAMHFPAKLAGVLGYSGALIWDEADDVAGLQKVPVHLVHGDADDVVPIMAYHHAIDKLRKEGFEVSGAIRPGLPHSIDEEGLQSGIEFLQKVLGV